MSTLTSLRIERIDDVPLLLTQMERLRLGELLDRHFPVHSNWRGLSLGGVTTIWLAHLLSQGDHRLNQVEPWAVARLQTLRAVTGQCVYRQDLTDDRLAAVLDALAHDQRWADLEASLAGTLLRVYALEPECLRVDMSTASSQRLVSEGGLFQWGQSKDHRPDLPQLKIGLTTLDPLGLPLATEVVAGNHTDDPLYRPLIQRVRAALGGSGRLYVGDVKMAALETRLQVEQAHDYYLCPLSAQQLPAPELDALLAPVWEGRQPLTELLPPEQPGAPPVAEGFEVREELAVRVGGVPVVWTERRLVVRSPARAASEAASLRGRVARAAAALGALKERGRGKTRYREPQKLWAAVQALLKRHQVADLIQVSCQEQVRERRVRRWRERPARVVVERDLQVSVTVEEAKLAGIERRLGWRVYATNAPAQRLPQATILTSYRGQWVIERGIGRLKGRPLSLTPLYLQKEERVVGLIRLLTLALRVLCLVEFAVRRGLAAADERLAGLYAGQPQRATEQPTSEMLLRAFGEINLVLLPGATQITGHLTPLSRLQEQILSLLALPRDTYTRLTLAASHPYPLSLEGAHPYPVSFQSLNPYPE